MPVSRVSWWGGGGIFGFIDLEPATLRKTYTIYTYIYFRWQKAHIPNNKFHSRRYLIYSLVVVILTLSVVRDRVLEKKKKVLPSGTPHSRALSHLLAHHTDRLHRKPLYMYTTRSIYTIPFHIFFIVEKKTGISDSSGSLCISFLF